VRLSHLTEAEKRAYILADNRLAEKAGWDREILAIELQALIDLDFEVRTDGLRDRRGRSLSPRKPGKRSARRPGPGR